MDALTVVVGRVIAEVTRQEVEGPVHDVVAGFELIFGIEPSVVVVCRPRRERQTDKHGERKNEETWERPIQEQAADESERDGRPAEKYGAMFWMPFSDAQRSRIGRRSDDACILKNAHRGPITPLPRTLVLCLVQEVQVVTEIVM